jgi:peptidoglycan/xylan/chitin deacetylase (PgdA/CDA1 family)
MNMATVFTCSTDDGHPSDMKMAELLDKNGLNGTFFVPIRNREGPPVMTGTQLREIGREFEIGSHTYDHQYLREVGLAEANRQITVGKSELEDLLGQPVSGFCYPGGKFTTRHVSLVQAAGFAYARTTTNLCFDSGRCRFEIPTTIQFYPHGTTVYWRNFVRAGRWNERSSALMVALRHSDWIKRVYALFDYSCQRGGAFHLWAHSGEIDALDAWRELDRFFAYVAERVEIQNRLSNHQLASRDFSR